MKKIILLLFLFSYSGVYADKYEISDLNITNNGVTQSGSTFDFSSGDNIIINNIDTIFNGEGTITYSVNPKGSLNQSFTIGDQKFFIAGYYTTYKGYNNCLMLDVRNGQGSSIYGGSYAPNVCNINFNTDIQIHIDFKSNTSFDVYYDGILKYTGNTAFNLSSHDKMYLGGVYNFTFNGEIKDFTIYSESYTPQNVPVVSLTCETVEVREQIPFYQNESLGDLELEIYDDSDNYYYSEYSNEYSLGLLNIREISSTGALDDPVELLKFNSLWNPIESAPELSFQNTNDSVYLPIDFLEISGSGNPFMIRMYDRGGNYKKVFPGEYNKFYNFTKDGGYYGFSLLFEKSYTVHNTITKINFGDTDYNYIDRQYCVNDDTGEVTLDGDPYFGDIDSADDDILFGEDSNIAFNAKTPEDLLKKCGYFSLAPRCFVPVIYEFLESVPGFSWLSSRYKAYSPFLDFTITPGSYYTVVKLPTGNNNLESVNYEFTIPTSYTPSNVYFEESYNSINPVINFFVLLIGLMFYFTGVVIAQVALVFGFGYFVFKMIVKIAHFLSFGELATIYDSQGKSSLLGLIFFGAFSTSIVVAVDYLFNPIIGELANIFSQYTESFGHIVSLGVSIFTKGQVDFIFIVNIFSGYILLALVGFFTYVVVTRFGRLF